MSGATQQDYARWRADPAAFITEVLRDPETEEPFELTASERRFLSHALQLDQQGRLRFPELVYAAPKKSGKSTFAAMVVLYMTLVLGGRHAEAYLVANDLEQAQGRVFEAVRKIVELCSWLRSSAKITQTQIRFPATGATITAIASDYAGAAGANPIISCFDELWGYTSERSHRLFDEMVPPPTRKIACRLTTTYAGFEGESELLEGLRKRGLSQPQIGPDLYAGDGMLMFWTHTPVAPWQDDAWLAQMRQQLRPNAYLRMIENRFVSTDSSFIDLNWWDQCVDPQARPLLMDRTLPVWLGVDASVKRDSTAIVVCSWDRAANKVRLVTHRIFQPSVSDPLDFEATIEATLLEMVQRFRVREVRFDPYQMQAVAQRLSARHVPMVEFAQTVPNLTEATSNLYELIKGGNLVAYPDEAVRLAVARSIAIETPRGWRIAKEKSSHKIDVIVALAQAALAAVQGGIAHQPMRIPERAMQRAHERPVRGAMSRFPSARPRWFMGSSSER
jgi:phage terminase large subunit-like protein